MRSNFKNADECCEDSTHWFGTLIDKLYRFLGESFSEFHITVSGVVDSICFSVQVISINPFPIGICFAKALLNPTDF